MFIWAAQRRYVLIWRRPKGPEAGGLASEIGIDGCNYAIV